jgi:hypothetical protein
MSKREDNTFSRADFVFKKRNVYICLSRRQEAADHWACRQRSYDPLHRLGAGLPRLLAQAALLPEHAVTPDPARCQRGRSRPTQRKMKTKAFLKSRDERKRVEMRFAHLKTHHGFERMRLRGLSGARDEFHLAAIVQNLKTMALHLLGPTTGGASATIA